MKVKVTQKDIDNGVAHWPGGCPLALAINRRTGRNDACVSYGSWAWLSPTNTESWSEIQKWPLPEDAQKFALLFDQNEKVEPAVFDL